MKKSPSAPSFITRMRSRGAAARRRRAGLSCGLDHGEVHVHHDLRLRAVAVGPVGVMLVGAGPVGAGAVGGEVGAGQLDQAARPLVVDR